MAAMQAVKFRQVIPAKKALPFKNQFTISSTVMQKKSLQKSANGDRVPIPA